MIAGIYRFINNRTGEVYVGQSFNVYARRDNHHKELSLGTHHNKGLQKDHDRGDTFTFEILEKMPKATREELKEREIDYIEKFNSFYEGYNQTPGGKYDMYKGKYKYGGGRLPVHKYKPVSKRPINQSHAMLSKAVKNYRPLAKRPINQSQIVWKTCNYCDKKINIVASVCPYCNRSLKKPTKTSVNIPKVKRNVKSKKSLKNDFEKFVIKKRNYLTKADCDFLAGKYDIDISTVKTVKQTNTIIRRELNKTNQWDCAMEKLYVHSIGTSVNSQKVTEKAKKSSISKDKTKSTSEPLKTDNVKNQFNYYTYLNNTLKEYNKNPINNEIASKTTMKNDITQKIEDKSSEENDFNYCNNCGYPIETKEIYCPNCGEKISRTSINQQKFKSTKKRNWNEIIGNIILIIIFVIFIFSMFILNSDIEGPISAIAEVIFISVICFSCWVNSGEK